MAMTALGSPLKALHRIIPTSDRQRRHGNVLARWVRDRKGASAILFALALPVIAGLAGLGVTTASWYPEKSELQEAANSGALAGASELATSTATQAVIETVATAAAVKSGFSGVTPVINQPPASGLFAPGRAYSDPNGHGGADGIDLGAEFACEGEILHQSVERRTTSPIAFWLQIDRDLGVHGWLADIGAPLRLPGAVLEGRMRVDYNPQGRLIGGEVTLDWPYVQDGAPLILTMMRETYMRFGPRFTRLAGDQTYLSAMLRFATESHPRLAGLRHAAAVIATCLPGPDLPPGPVTE